MYKKFDLFFGFVVIGVFLWFLYVLLSASFYGTKTYSVKAMFSSADGILRGTDVKIAGVKVGEVISVTANPETFTAQIDMKVYTKFHIPTDSSASVQSSGLIGEKYIEIAPGFEEENIKDGGIIKITQSSVNLEKLIGSFASGGIGSKKTEEEKPKEAAEEK